MSLKNYTDGELYDELERRKSERDRIRDSCEHKNLIFCKEQESFHSRKGCLDCDTWLEPLRMKSNEKAEKIISELMKENLKVPTSSSILEKRK